MAARIRRGLRPTNTRALRNRRIQPPSSPHALGAHEFCTVRNTRSGCGMTRGDAAVGAAHAGDAQRRAVRIVGIALGRLIAMCRRTASVTRPCSSSLPAAESAAEFRESLAVRAPRSAAPSRACRRTAPNSNAAPAPAPARASYCSERLRTKRGQPSVPGINSLQRRQHLAAVAHAQGERARRARRRPANSSRASGLNRIDLAQPSPGAEHIAVGKAAAGDQPMEPRQTHAPLQDVGHVHVVGVEPGAGEHRRHLGLAVDTLFAQHRDRGSRTAAI